MQGLQAVRNWWPRIWVLEITTLEVFKCPSCPTHAPRCESQGETWCESRQEMCHGILPGPVLPEEPTAGPMGPFAFQVHSLTWP